MDTEVECGIACANCSLVKNTPGITITFSKSTTLLRRLASDSGTAVSIAEAFFKLFEQKVDPHMIWCDNCVHSLRRLYVSHSAEVQMKKEFTTLTSSSSFVSTVLVKAMNVVTPTFMIPLTPDYMVALTPTYVSSVFVPQTGVTNNRTCQTSQFGTSMTTATTTMAPNIPTSGKNFGQNYRYSEARKPLCRTILDAMSTVRKRNAVYAALKRILRKEAKKLCQLASLKEPITSVEPVTTYSKIEEDLLENAPTIHCILNSLCPYRPTKRFSLVQSQSAMLSIFGIVLQANNRLCNRIQKIVGLHLWKERATMRTFEILARLGISSDHTSTVRLKNELCEQYYKEYDDHDESAVAVLLEPAVSKSNEAQNITKSEPMDDDTAALDSTNFTSQDMSTEEELLDLDQCAIPIVSVSSGSLDRIKIRWTKKQVSRNLEEEAKKIMVAKFPNASVSKFQENQGRGKRILDPKTPSRKEAVAARRAKQPPSKSEHLIVQRKPSDKLESSTKLSSIIAAPKNIPSSPRLQKNPKSTGSPTKSKSPAKKTKLS